MRLLHIIAGARRGGAETFFTDLARGLSKSDIEQHAVTRLYRYRLSHLRQSHCGYSVAKMGGPLDLVSFWQVRQAAKRFSPDVILTWMNRASRYAPRGPWKIVGRLGGYYDLKYYRACDYLVCNTPDLLRHCVERGWPEDRVDYIPNFSPVMDVKPVARRNLDTPEGVPVLLVLARFTEVKAIDVALRALVDLPTSFLWLAGEGELEPELRVLAESLGVSARVRFLGWRNDRESLLAAADVCVVPSRYEPFGNVVINAWQAETPIVAASSQGPSFLINHNENGLLVPIDDPVALSRSINVVLADSALQRRLVSGGRASIEASFSEREVVDSYLALFEKLLENP